MRSVENLASAGLIFFVLKIFCKYIIYNFDFIFHEILQKKFLKLSLLLKDLCHDDLKYSDHLIHQSKSRFCFVTHFPYYLPSAIFRFTNFIKEQSVEFVKD